MEKSVDWFAENSWPARNNYMDTENENQSCSQDEDTSDWLAENSWPASSKYFDGKEEESDSQVSEKGSEDEDPPPNWFAEHSWPASKKCEKEEEKKSSASEESWLRETGWAVRHEMREEVATQHLGGFDYNIKLCHQGESEQDQKGRTQPSCCSIL